MLAAILKPLLQLFNLFLPFPGEPFNLFLVASQVRDLLCLYSFKFLLQGIPLLCDSGKHAAEIPFCNVNLNIFIQRKNVLLCLVVSVCAVVGTRIYSSLSI